MGRREAFTRGHTSFFHSSTARSSRSRALRAGACQDQPCRFSSRHTVATDRLTRRRRRITVWTRARVQRSSSKPCADGPLPSSSSSTANWESVTESWPGLRNARPPCHSRARHGASVPPTAHSPADPSRSPRSSHPPRTARQPSAGSPHETPDAQQSGPHPPDNAYHRHTAGIMNRHYPTTTRKPQ